MGKKHLKVVPKSNQPQPIPVVEKAKEPVVKACPPAARKLIQHRIDEVKLAQLKLREMVDAVAAGLGIDHKKERWEYKADLGVFVKAQ